MIEIVVRCWACRSYNYLPVVSVDDTVEGTCDFCGIDL